MHSNMCENAKRPLVFVVEDTSVISLTHSPRSCRGSVTEFSEKREIFLEENYYKMQVKVPTYEKHNTSGVKAGMGGGDGASAYVRWYYLTYNVNLTY